jgi:hypothetical protein
VSNSSAGRPPALFTAALRCCSSFSWARAKTVSRAHRTTRRCRKSRNYRAFSSFLLGHLLLEATPLAAQTRRPVGFQNALDSFGTLQVNHLPAALLSLLQDTARIKESRAALVQARRTDPTSGCPAKIEEPGWRRRTATLATP